MEVYVHLYTQSEPVYIKGVKNCYQKGDLYCVMVDDGENLRIDKFPLKHIFRITEIFPKNNHGCR